MLVLHRKYRPGDQVQVETTDGWFSGIVRDHHYLDIGTILFVKLEDGRMAACTSAACIRRIE